MCYTCDSEYLFLRGGENNKQANDYSLAPSPLFGNAFLLLVLTITMESEKRNTLGNLTNLTYLKMAFCQAI